MSDYTPTTEDIKYAYAHWKGQEPEFDRWLAEVKAQERQIERDRLLALAEGDVRGCSGDDCEECSRMCLIEDLREVTKDWVEDWDKGEEQ